MKNSILHDKSANDVVHGDKDSFIIKWTKPDNQQEKHGNVFKYTY